MRGMRRNGVQSIAAVVIAGLLLWACSSASPEKSGAGPEQPRGGEDAEQLPGETVLDYEGPRIDPLSEYIGASIQGTQQIDIEEYRLKVDGLVEKSLELPYAEVLDYPRYEKTVEIVCVEGWTARLQWTGIKVEDVLDTAGVRDGAGTIIFHSVDGYSTSLPLEYLTSRDILLAYRVNERTLPAEHGYPFQLVAEAKYGYKWAKWVTRIEVSDNSEFRGYWESRGYSKDGNVGEPMFD